MEITPVTPKTRGVIVDESSENSEYPHYLQFYADPPTDDLTLKEFEELAVDRLKGLKVIENVLHRHSGKIHSDAYKKDVLDTLRNQKYGDYVKMIYDDRDEFDIRRKDHLSHYFLRLSFCQSEEHRKWFLEHETEMFRLKLGLQPFKTKIGFIKREHLPFEEVSIENTSSEMGKQLTALYPFYTSDVFKHVFKVHFIYVESLIKRRRVVLKEGYCYLPFHELETLVLNEFRTRISLGMARMRRVLPHFEQDERCYSILRSLPDRYTGKEFTKKDIPEGVVTEDMIEDLAKTSFPPCMKTLHDTFHQRSHMRHGARRQYGLFLKGIGMNMEANTRYMKSVYCKKYTDDEFAKRFLYNIRHSYGAEGKRANYRPFSCVQVILGPIPGPEDTHGCPFRHYDPESLRKYLQQNKIPNDMKNKIVDLAAEKRYDIACSVYFETTHQKKPGQLITHPNQYFEESRKSIDKTPVV